MIRKADRSEGAIPTTFITEVLEGANEPGDNYKQIQSDRELERESKKRHEENLKKQKREEEKILEKLAKKKMAAEEDIKRRIDSIKDCSEEKKIKQNLSGT